MGGWEGSLLFATYIYPLVKKVNICLQMGFDVLIPLTSTSRKFVPGRLGIGRRPLCGYPPNFPHFEFICLP